MRGLPAGADRAVVLVILCFALRSLFDGVLMFAPLPWRDVSIVPADLMAPHWTEIVWARRGVALLPLVVAWYALHRLRRVPAAAGHGLALAAFGWFAGLFGRMATHFRFPVHVALGEQIVWAAHAAVAAGLLLFLVGLRRVPERSSPPRGRGGCPPGP